MTKLYLSAFFFAALLSLAACKTASKAYDKGNYTDAIELAVKKLQKNPNDGEAKALVQSAYRFAVDKHQDNIRMLSKSNTETQYEQIYNEYRQLQYLYDLVRQAPALNGVVRTTDYTEYVNTYRDKAADVYLQKGLAKMQLTEKKDFREAYRYFQRAQNFKNDDSVRRLKDEAYQASLTRVVLLPMNNDGFGYQYSNNAYQLRNFEQDLMRTLRYNSNNEFVKFYTEREARNEDIHPDEVLEMRLNRMDIGRPYDQQNSRNVSKEVVVKEVVHKPDSITKQYAKVSAQITVTRRTMISEGDLYVVAKDDKGLTLWSDIIRGQHRWQTEFATYRGDDRALSDSDRALLNRNDYNPPREEEVMEAVLQQIENEMQYRMRSHYGRY